jgi:formylglycine-generating enzyme required for sulfatase activity
MGMLRQLLTMHPAEGPGSEEANFIDLTPKELRTYIYLTSRTVPEPAGSAAVRFAEPQMVSIPEGEFLMGSTPEQVADLVRQYPGEQRLFEEEEPQHRIHLPAYQIGKYTITNVEYRSFVRDTNHRAPPDWEGEAYPEGLGDHPVIAVSWHDARAFCDWLREKTGRPYRLPTEAQWEKAARGEDARAYPWGNEFNPANCNSLEGEVRGTTPVGQYSPQGDSPYGAGDMAGNVWEWTSTLYRPYPYDAEDGREDAESGDPRVARGGAFSNDWWFVRCAYRGRRNPDDRSDGVGFRVLVSPGSP